MNPSTRNIRDNWQRSPLRQLQVYIIYLIPVFCGVSRLRIQSLPDAFFQGERSSIVSPRAVPHTNPLASAVSDVTSAGISNKP